MKKIYTLLAALLVVLTAGAQNILPEGKDFAGVGDQVTSFDAIESGELYVLKCKVNAEGYNYENENDHKIYKSGSGAATATAVVKITKVDGQANTATIQAYSGTYYQTLVENQQVRVGESAANYTFEKIGNNFYVKVGDFTINDYGNQPTGKNRNSASGDYSRFSIYKVVLRDKYAYNLVVYGLPEGNHTTFALSGTPFTPGTTLNAGEAKTASDLTVSDVPEGYEVNSQNSIALIQSTNTFVVTAICKKHLDFGETGKYAVFAADNFATSIDPDKWYLISNKRGDDHSGDQYPLPRGTQRFALDNGGKFYMNYTSGFQNGGEVTANNDVYLFHFIPTDKTNQYYVQCADGKYFGNLSHGVNLSANEPDQGGFPFRIQQIGNNAGFFYIQNLNNNIIMDNNSNPSNNSMGTVVGWNPTPPTSNDGNNVWQLVPVDFTTEVYTVTYQMKDSKTDELLYTYQQKAGKGSTVTYNGPAPSTFAAFTTPVPIANITQDQTVDISVTQQNLPFIPSASYDNATWYYWQNATTPGGNNLNETYVYYSNGNISFSKDKDNTEAYKWAFIGNSVKGFKIVNKAGGAGHDLNAANGNNGTKITMSDTEKYWPLVQGALSSSTSANSITRQWWGYLFSFQLGNGYINNYRGVGNLAFYNVGPTGDAGSNWAAILADFSTYSVDMHTVGSNSYGTAYVPVAVTVGEGTKAYTMTSANGTEATLTETTGTIPANTPVVLIGEAGATTATLTASADAASEAGGNLLSGLDVPTQAGTDNYYLGVYNGNVGFYKLGGAAAQQFSVNKAYLPAENVPSGAKGFTFAFETVTGISSVNAGKAAAADAPRYNLAGQRVDKSYKGVVIAGGRKVLVK